MKRRYYIVKFELGTKLYLRSFKLSTHDNLTMSSAWCSKSDQGTRLPFLEAATINAALSSWYSNDRTGCREVHVQMEIAI